MLFFRKARPLTPDEVLSEQLHTMNKRLGILIQMQEYLMVDTTKILAATSAAKTREESLIVLVNGLGGTLKSVSADLAAARAANDPAALAKVQTDLDNAADALNLEAAPVQAAIDANTDKPAEAPAPASPADTPPQS